MGLIQSAEEKHAEQMQQDAQAFSRQMMKNKYQWQVADLTAAGLNPLLAVTNPPSIAGSPAPTAQNLHGGLANLAGTASKLGEAGMKGGKYSLEREILKSQNTTAKEVAKQSQTETKIREADKRIRDNEALASVELPRIAVWDRMTKGEQALQAAADRVFSEYTTMYKKWEQPKRAADYALDMEPPGMLTRAFNRLLRRMVGMERD